MGLKLKLAVLRMDGEYFGQGTTLEGQTFDALYMSEIREGYLLPPSDSGLGSPSQPLSWIGATGGVSGYTNAKRGIDFTYTKYGSDSRHRYTASASSTTFETALSNTSASAFTSVAAVDGYTML